MDRRITNHEFEVATLLDILTSADEKVKQGEEPEHGRLGQPRSHFC